MLQSALDQLVGSWKGASNTHKCSKFSVILSKVLWHVVQKVCHAEDETALQDRQSRMSHKLHLVTSWVFCTALCLLRY